MSRAWGPPPSRRPPWWPEGEPFPPRGRRGYGPPPFIRALGCFLLVALAMALLVGGAIGALLSRQEFHPFVLFPILVLVLIAVAVGGGMRRMTQPMSNLITAARRIESGDYAARVPEYGSQDIRSVARAFNSMSERLRVIDEQRRSFMAEVTHELRTPLSVIRGQAEAIADGVYPADAEHLAPILDATETLDRLVEDLRTLVLTDSGTLVLHKEPTDVAALVRDTSESFRSQSQTAGISLSAAADDNAPIVEVDPARMRQVISNLLTNAIRHTPPGGSVRVSVGSAADQVTISVSDTGEGIPPDLLPHVFDRFVKGPQSTGSGLGLAIARDIAVAHGGRIDVSSTPGDTTFRFSFPR